MVWPTLGSRTAEEQNRTGQNQVGEVGERGQNVLRQIVDVVDARHGASDV